MTTGSLESFRRDHALLLDLGNTFSNDEWARPSGGCPGWSVKDIVTHLGVTLAQLADRRSLSDTAGVPLERANDVHVEARREWSPDRLLADYRDIGQRAVARMESLLARDDLVVPMGEMGTYPFSKIVSAYAWDHFTHIRTDIVGPYGPVQRDEVPWDQLGLDAALDWMLAALPQQCGAAIPPFAGIVNLELEGTASRASSLSSGAGGIDLHPGAGATPVAEIRSTTADFIRWGTKRARWADLVRIEGDREIAARVLDGIRIF